MIHLSELSRDWLKNSADYRPSAFWFWNADMEPAAMEAFAAEMARNGVREFLIHPSHGLEIEYLSDEYFNRYRFGLELGKKYGMKVWVYDEFAWPSGVAGGRVLREHLEFCGWCLKFQKDGNGNITAQPQKLDCILDNAVGAPWMKSFSGYIDMLSPTAVRCFIETTYERVFRECGKYFGEVITGFFTDEPALMFGCKGDHDGPWCVPALPWTPEFPKLFKERFGYDIEPRYAELGGRGFSSARRDYWQLIKEIHSEAYHGQIGRWCQAHGVKYTGHLGEDDPIQEVRFAGSPFACLKHMNEPGIDYLGAGAEPEDRCWEQVLIPSIARHAGRKRVFCEAFGISHFNLRLGEMLRRVQLMAIHGIDDIALMAFCQKSDGIRKRTYWPPLFTNAPWWEFYPGFRDAFARSVALVSLGTRQARYAILYPQNQIEQTDPFVNPWHDTEFITPVLQRLATAVYKAGETFEIIFPEILDQAKIENGKIIFPYAEYEAILISPDFTYFEASNKELKRIAVAGGRVVGEPIQNPPWQNPLKITGGKSFRVYRFEYPDGVLFAVRNVTPESAGITISSDQSLTEWDPVQGRCIDCGRKIQWTMDGHRTRYVSVSKKRFSATPFQKNNFIPIQIEWKVTSDRPNLARFSGLQFFDEKAGWVDPVRWSFSPEDKPRFCATLPEIFAGRTQIAMRGEFFCDSIPKHLGVLFEHDHLSALAVNGWPVDLSKIRPLPVWDDSCVTADICGQVVPGKNTVAGTLKFAAWETGIVNDAFFRRRLMPSCDMCLAGTFRLAGRSLIQDSGRPVALPVDLSAVGWEQYAGVLALTGRITVDADLAGKINGILIEPIGEDALEVLLNGISLGKLVTSPYHFDIPSLSTGSHELCISLAATSANILDTPEAWGVKTVSFVVSTG